MAEVTQNNLDTVLGRLVVEQGLATAEEVQQCLEKQRQLAADGDPSQRSLTAVLIEKGVVTQRQVDRLRPQLEEQNRGHQIPGFKMLERIGAGAMATVYKARQLSLDRPVAIKILPRKYTNNQQFIDRFYAEGKAAAKLNHPNIVQAIDVGKAGDTHFFVMEFVEGRTVFDDIVEHGRYSESDALKIIIQIARALDHSHQAGFIHRDVKPKNIMLAKDGGKAKLADMGLARAVSDVEAAEAEAGKAYGTPYYISPEQIRGEIDVDFRADIYSLGATLYHMVTGQIPFDGPNPSAVMHKHLKNEIIPPDHLNPELSTGIGEIIEVCMAKSPGKRYNTTADLLEDLEAVTRGEPPLQARKKFDLAALTTLEGDAEQPTAVSLDARADLASQPLFWVMLAGWGVAILLGILLLALIFPG